MASTENGNAEERRGKGGRRLRERRERRPSPLDAARLRELALRYVERFQTSEARLARYLGRKIREQGWKEGAPPADVEALTREMAGLGYVDDEAYADAKARSLARRGMGGRRIRQALGDAGIDADVTARLTDTSDPWDAALVFARRKRIGPFGYHGGDPRLRRRQMAAMARAGHSFDVARAIVDAESADEIPTPDQR